MWCYGNVWWESSACWQTFLSCFVRCYAGYRHVHILDGAQVLAGCITGLEPHIVPTSQQLMVQIAQGLHRPDFLSSFLLVPFLFAPLLIAGWKPQGPAAEAAESSWDVAEIRTEKCHCIWYTHPAFWRGNLWELQGSLWCLWHWTNYWNTCAHPRSSAQWHLQVGWEL